MTDIPSKERHFDKLAYLSDLIHHNDIIHQRDQQFEKYSSTPKLAADLPTMILDPKDNGNIYDTVLPHTHCVYPPKDLTSSSKELTGILFLAGGAIGGAAGSWAASPERISVPPSPDLSLQAKQKDLLASIKSIPNSQIGTAEEMNVAKRFLSPDTHLSYHNFPSYENNWAKITELFPAQTLTKDYTAAALAKEPLSFAAGPLRPLSVGGGGDGPFGPIGPLGPVGEGWLARTLAGAGRGLAVAAGLMAIGYAWEQVGKMMAPMPDEIRYEK